MVSPVKKWSTIMRRAWPLLIHEVGRPLFQTARSGVITADFDCSTVQAHRRGTHFGPGTTLRFYCGITALDQFRNAHTFFSCGAASHSLLFSNSSIREVPLAEGAYRSALTLGTYFTGL